MESSLQKWRIISTEALINVLQESNRNNERFCFILGSGASVESGIPICSELEKRWMACLMGESTDGGAPPKDPERVREYAKLLKEDDLLQFDFSEIEKEWQEVKEGKKTALSNKYYYDLYTLRFYPNPNNAYRYLQRLMESTEPSLGYRILARFLTDKNKNNLVITTNFDSLTEDALFLYTDKKPLVLNHELLADYISDQSINRPIISKVHNGLFTKPLINVQNMNQLKEEWCEALSSVFQIYTPIVIGYNGGDQSLMEFLKSDDVRMRNGIYWCYLPQDDLPDENIQNMVYKKNGYLVSIDGFDALMADIGSRLYPNEISPEFTNNALRQQYYTRIEQYTKRWNELHSESQQINELKKSELIAENQREQAQSLTDFDLFRRGIRFYDNGQYEKAVTCLIQAIDLNSDYAPAYNALGMSYDSLGDYNKAIDNFNKAIELNPNYSTAYNNRGNSYDNLEEYNRAIDDYTKAIELNPNDATAYYNRGNVYYLLQEYNNAIKDYTLAIELDPTDATAYNNRGSTYDNLQNYNMAISDYSKAIELDPEYSTAYNNRAITYDNLHDYDNAVKDYTKAIEIDPNYANAYNNRGYLYNQLEEYDKAVEDYTKAIRLNPKYKELYLGRAKAYEMLGKMDLAEADEAKAAQLE